MTKYTVEDSLNIEIPNQEEYGVQYWPIFNADKFVGCCGMRPYDALKEFMK